MFSNIIRYKTGSWLSYVFEKDDPKLPRKRNVSSHYEEEKAPVEFVYKVEEYYLHLFYQATEILVSCIRNRFQQKDYIETLQKMEITTFKSVAL